MVNPFKMLLFRDRRDTIVHQSKYRGYIRDPRTDDSIETVSTRYGEVAPLEIAFPYGDDPISDPLLVANLLWKFPAQMVMYCSDHSAKELSLFWKEFTPDIEPIPFVGITTLNDAGRLGLTNYFDRHCDWYLWTFVLFDRDQLQSLEGELKAGLYFKDEGPFDDFASHARYTVICNRDIGETSVMVFDPELFDPMVEFLRPLCEEWKG